MDEGTGRDNDQAERTSPQVLLYESLVSIVDRSEACCSKAPASTPDYPNVACVIPARWGNHPEISTKFTQNTDKWQSNFSPILTTSVVAQPAD